jgi:hypothetical protein
VKKKELQTLRPVLHGRSRKVVSNQKSDAFADRLRKRILLIASIDIDSFLRAFLMTSVMDSTAY